MELLPDNSNAPTARSGHVAITWRDHMYIWGGYNHDENDTERWIDSKIVWKYSLDSSKWTRHKIKEIGPPPIVGCTFACVDGKMVIFGGCGYMNDYNHIWVLRLSNLRWELLEPRGLKPSPRNKTACCVYESRLIVFGGYGPEPIINNHLGNGDFDIDESSLSWTLRGWNNDLVAYDFSNNTWTTLDDKGPRPSSRAAHAMTAFGNKAFIYGGRHLMERLDDLYSLCLDTFQWTAINYDVTFPYPIGRSWHSLTALSDSQLFLFGGIDTETNLLDDSWIYDSLESCWRKAPVKRQCRLWHTACHGVTREEMLVFGGCITSIFANTKHSDQVLHLSLQPKSLLRICLEVLTLHKTTWKGKSGLLPVCLYRKLSNMSGDGG